MIMMHSIEMVVFMARLIFEFDLDSEEMIVAAVFTTTATWVYY